MQPYTDPEPRSFAQWCIDLGINSEDRAWPPNQVMTYLEFCSLPETTLRKTSEGASYGFWCQYGDIYGEPRTVKEWLDDIGWHLVEPTEDDLKDLNSFLGQDEFWTWSGGKIEQDLNASAGISLFEKLRQLFAKK